MFFRRDRTLAARLKADGGLIMDGGEGTIHKLGRYLAGGSPCNGWIHWYYESLNGELRPIDELRQQYRRRMSTPDDETQKH